MTEPASIPRIIRFGTFELDSSSGELHRQGIKIKIQQQPFQVLEQLLRRAGEVVTREDLRNSLWAADTFIDFDHSLGSAINRIREALGDSAKNPRFVETLPGRGFRFIAPIDGSPEESEGNITVLPAVPRWRSDPHRLWFVGLGLLVLLILVVGSKVGWWQRLGGGPAPARIQSIAVLPLENLTGDPAQGYFVDGMTDALITDLAQISALRVISRTSVMQYRGSHKPLQEIVQELHVDAVLEGSVVRSGDRVRVNAQLIHAATDRHLWARSYERESRDIMALQGDVAQAIASEIRIKLTPQEQARLARSRPANFEAYEAYLRGRYFWDKRTEAGLWKGIEYFEQAIQKDPNYALAYAGLADSYVVLNFFGDLPPSEATSRSKAAVRKALDIDEALGEAHAALAVKLFVYDWDWTAAEKEFQRAIELNPNYATAHQWYGQYLEAMGRREESIAQRTLAHELDPVSSGIGVADGGAMARRQYDVAIEKIRKKLDLYPNFAFTHLNLGQVYEQQGKYEEAIAELQKAVSLSESNLYFLGILGEAYGAAGKRAEAVKILRELERLSKKRYVSAYPVALVYIGLGDKNRTFAWLEKAYEERAAPLVLIKVDRKFDSLHSDPRFADLVRRMGLPQ